MKSFTLVFIFTFFSFLCFQSCLFNTHSTKGNGNIVNKDIAISDYQEVEVSLGADVVYEQQSAKEPYFQICVDENILPLINVEVEGNKLVIKSEKNQNIQPSRLTIYTNSKNLSKVDLNGSGEFHLKGAVNSKDMDIRLSGSGDIVSDSLYCEKISLSITGSGGANLKGASNNASLEVTGSGTINASNYSIQDLVCKITGSGGIQTYVGEKLDASITGSGNVEYKGNPEVSTHVTGSGNVRRAN